MYNTVTKTSPGRIVWSQLVDLVYPPRCDLCGRDGVAPICQDCLDKSFFIERPFCRRCNVPFPEGQDDRLFCSDCLHGQFYLAAGRSVALHAGPMRYAISRLKFHGAKRLIPIFAEMIMHRIEAEADDPDGLPFGDVTALVPAILHPRRRRWRGFDQTLDITKAIAELWRIPVLNALERVHHTKPQVRLDYSQRRRNMAHAFRMRPGADVKGMVVVVVDDVWTTGATLEACAQALHRGKAARVYGLTVTRTPPPWHEAAAEKHAVEGA